MRFRDLGDLFGDHVGDVGVGVDVFVVGLMAAYREGEDVRGEEGRDVVRQGSEEVRVRMVGDGIQ